MENLVMSPGDAERIGEEIKRHLAQAAEAKSGGDTGRMRAEAETAAMLFANFLAKSDGPQGLKRLIASALQSAGYGDADAANLLSGGQPVAGAKKARGQKNDIGVGPSTPPKVGVPHHGPHPAPKTLPGFPDAQPAKRKTPVQGGGGLRKRWKDAKKKRIYEWDSQHGEVEEWDWSGKRHQGSYAPDGTKLKGPDPTKKPITPTIAKPMDAATTFSLYWFSAESDDLVGEVDLPDLTAGEVRTWFCLPEDEPLTDSYVVRASQRRHLARLVREELDLNAYDYFLECFAAEEG
jgi:hypothetical protein